jgi:mono/diheme cytochrome c family protein
MAAVHQQGLRVLTALFGLAATCVGRGVGGPGERAPTPPEYRQIVQPFIQKHCLECHGEKKAQAGFRIDRLSTDFTRAKMAEQWKEVIDRINAAEMPPRGKPRPDVQEAAAVVTWVNRQLRDLELVVRNAGGHIPMRRLNRDEYANTVRDLLKLDENIVRPLIEELPGDGKAEGFDRLGVALFFDQTQIERSLAWIPIDPLGPNKGRGLCCICAEKTGFGALILLVFSKSDKPISTITRETGHG